MLTSIDLFAGPGGLCTGFRAAGIQPLIAVEWSFWTAKTYSTTHKTDILPLDEYLNNPSQYKHLFCETDKPILIYGDINKVTNDLILTILKKRFKRNSVDIVTGGAPCESFSMAGQRKEDDERNLLFQNIPRIAKAVNAKLFMFENVKGLFSKKLDGEKGAMYDFVCNYLEKDSSDGVSFKLVSKDKETVLLKASDYGVPQNRERLFLVGINKKYNYEFHYPEKTNGDNCPLKYVTVGDAISDLPFADGGKENSKYSYKRKKKETPEQKVFLDWVRGDVFTPPDSGFIKNRITSHVAPGHLPRIIERFKLIKVGENQRTTYLRIKAEDPKSHDLSYFSKTLYGARNRRLNNDKPCFTVTSHCLDEMVHPSLNRALTPREIARLQSFPDWYDFQGPFVAFHGDKDQDRYEQIGDAIPPLLAYALAKSIIQALGDKKHE